MCFAALFKRHRVNLVGCSAAWGWRCTSASQWWRAQRAFPSPVLRPRSGSLYAKGALQNEVVDADKVSRNHRS